MRYLIVTTLSLGLAACSGSGISDYPRMANLHWYEGAWESEDGQARQVISAIVGGYSGALYFKDGDDWVRVSSGRCIRRNVPLEGWYVTAPIWNCDYYPENGADMGFEALSQSAYLASSFNPPGLQRFGDGTTFVNRARQGDTETVTYEHWTRPSGGRFTYQLWQLDAAGDPQPWMSGAWTLSEETNT